MELKITIQELSTHRVTQKTCEWRVQTTRRKGLEEKLRSFPFDFYLVSFINVIIITIVNEYFREQRQFSGYLEQEGLTLVLLGQTSKTNNAIQNHKSTGYKRYKPTLQDTLTL